MGDPKKQKNKYSKPRHPWQAKRIDYEKGLLKKYGLKNKKEIWKAVSFLEKVKKQAQNLIASTTKQAEKEKKQLLDKLAKLNLIMRDAKIEDVLDINVEAALNRRLQSIVIKKELAQTPKQARQLIIHRHITIGERIVTIPSYMIPLEEEDLINFSNSSKLNNEDHPLRVVLKNEKQKKASVEEKTETKKEPAEETVVLEGVEIKN